MMIFMKETKLDIRRIWAVLTLLDGTKKTQKQIEDEINVFDDRMSSINEKLNDEFSKGIKKELKTRSISKEEKTLAIKGLEAFKKFERISFKSSSKTEIFGFLEEQGIIRRRDIPVESTNLREKLCWIPIEFETFSNISNLIASSRIKPNRMSFFSNLFVSSKMGGKFFDDFLSSLPKKLTYLKPPINKKESKMVKILIRASLSCLNYVMDDIRFRTIDVYHNKFTFLLQLQALFLSDIAQRKSFSPLIADVIEFKSSLSLKKKSNIGADNVELNINMNLENDQLKTKLEVIPPTKNVSFDTLVYRYLRDTKLQAVSNLEMMVR